LVAERAGHRCEYCRAPEIIFNFPFEVKHILPRSYGGGDQLENLALACRSCNLYKSDCRNALDPDSNEEVPLFQPRQDTWADHFKLASTGEIQGLTTIGRATIMQLQINSELQCSARQQWFKLGIIP
jgi:HNH endonuclease